MYADAGTSENGGRRRVVGLGDFGISKATGVSADGSVVVGRRGDEAVRWTSGGGTVGLGLGNLGGSFQSIPTGVSADGSVVVGYYFHDDGLTNGMTGFRWTSVGGMVDLGDSRAALGVSADGSVVVGLRGDEAFRWTSGGGTVGLGDFGISEATGVSADGSVVVGSDGYTAVRWTSGGGTVGLGDLEGGFGLSTATGVSADGSAVVGRVLTASNGQEAFVWDEAEGMRSLKTVLEDSGIDMTGWRLSDANGISGDGTTIAGYGTHNGTTEAFVAVIPEPSTVSLLGLGAVAGIMLRRRRTKAVPKNMPSASDRFMEQW